MTDGGRQGDAGQGVLPPPSPRASGPHPEAPVTGPVFAHWLRRVVATLLDSSVLALLTWIAFPLQPVDPPATLPLAGGAVGTITTAPTADVWTSSGVVVGAVVVGLLLQAYLGSTPGKLVVGIAVVRQDDYRPAGLLRVLGREVLHVLDLIFFVGYLRPLWNRRRETFADTLASTVVLQTRAPLPYVLAGPVVHRWRSRPASDAVDGLLLEPWQLSAPPRWRRVATWVATAACAAGVVYTIGGESGRGATVLASCSVVEPSDAAVSLTGARVEVRDGAETRTRLWLTRTMVTEPPGVVVDWGWEGEWSSDDDLRFRVAVRDTSGEQRRWEYPFEGDGLAVPAGQAIPDRPQSVRLPLEGLGLTGPVRVEADAVLNGTPIRGCAVETTIPPAR